MAIAKSATVAATEVGVGVGIDVAAAIAVSVGGATFGPSVTAHATPRTVKRAMTIVAILNRAVTYDGPMSADVATGYILYSILIALTHESSRRTAHGIYRGLDGRGRERVYGTLRAQDRAEVDEHSLKRVVVGCFSVDPQQGFGT